VQFTILEVLGLSEAELREDEAIVDTIRILGPGDEAALEAFLADRADTSMFLRSNLRRAGIVDRGERYQGTYVGDVRDGRVTATACLCWNRNLVIQAPGDAEGFFRAAAKFFPRPVGWMTGPADQVVRARTALGLKDAPSAADETERLYSLDLDALAVPAALASGAAAGRRSTADDLTRLAVWRAEFNLEVFGGRDTHAFREDCRRIVKAHHEEGVLWLLEAEGDSVATSDFNAHLPDIVQIGGVYTPPEFRSRGFARSVVAASLLDARARGAARAVLFTNNPPAQRAYEALGFEHTGEFGLVRFDEAHDVRT
jgi:RimJ/RimL family protein N-acetyltransferase